MRCSRCNFENIPGQKKCLKCGSVLEISDAVVDIYPPRMSAWKKPLRNASRWFRRKTAIADGFRGFAISGVADKILSDELVGLLISIIPGLAHLIKGRFKEIRFFFIAWLFLLFFGLFFYGSSTGFILLGLAIGVHAWIGLKYGLFKEISRVVERIVILLIVIFLLTLVYRAAPRVLFPNLIGGYTPLAVPYYNIKSGDYLLARRIAKQSRLSRGSIVMFRPARIAAPYRRYTLSSSQGMTVGEVIGLPGELVEIKNTVFLVNGQQLDPEKFPVPNWLRNRQASITLADDSYFVSSHYGVTIRGQGSVTDQHISGACVIKSSDIEARAFMRWWPIWRRGFIR